MYAQGLHKNNQNQQWHQDKLYRKEFGNKLSQVGMIRGGRSGRNGVKIINDVIGIGVQHQVGSGL